MTTGFRTLQAVLAICAVFSTSACNQTDGTSELAPPQVIRAALLADLEVSAQRTQMFPFHVHDSMTVFNVEPSQAVDGLSYHWARHAVPEAPHANYIGAIVAARGGKHRVVKNAGDWWAAVGAWRPVDGDNAAQACLELYHVLHDGSPEVQTPFLAQKESSLPSIDSAELRQLREAADDEIHIQPPESPDESWQVTAWILAIRPLLAGRYRCIIPAAGDGSGTAQLILIDSIARKPLIQP